MGQRLFWAACIALALGVFVRTFVLFGWVTIGFFLAAASVAAIAYALRREFPALFLAVCLCAFSLGALRMHTGIIESEALVDAEIGEKVVLEGVVQSEPDMREDTVRLAVRITAIASTSIERDIAVLVVAPLHTEAEYGDRVRTEGELALPEAFETGEGRVFEYPGFLAKDRILYQMSFAKVTRLEGGEGNFLKSWAIWLKQKYLEGLANALNEPQAGLAGGITVGDKRGLGEELSDTFRVVGLTHIVVLSGYNIMVVVEALLRWLSRSPQALRLGIAGFVAFFFAAITGFASASTRAAAMAMIAITGKALGRTYLAARALALVAAGMILWNPYVLVFDPGFQLSILATAGLIFIAPIIEPYLKWFTPRFGLREIASATLGTQIAVLPLLLYQNGTLTLYSLPANLLSLAVIPAAMLFSAIAAISGLFAGVVAPIIGLPAYALLSYVIYVAKGFAALPLASMTLPAFGVEWLLTAYAVLSILVIRYGKGDRENSVA
jgi:competence protein ComEC